MTIMDISLFLVMTAFNILNWLLALNGDNTLDFWKQLFEDKERGECATKFVYSFTLWRENMYMFFGTQNFFRILSPSLRSLPFTGLEWSFLLFDKGYNLAGERIKRNEDIEMSPRLNEQNNE